MSNKKNSFSLFRYYFISFFALIFSGLVYKTVFVAYSYSQFASLSIAEISYAVFWGIRFDLASAALLTLISCLFLWGFVRFTNRKIPAQFFLGLMLFVQFSLQTGDSIYFSEAGRHVSYEMRDVLTDASGLLMTALTKHFMFIISSYLLGLLVVFAVLNIPEKFFTKPVAANVQSGISVNYEVKLIVILLLSVVFVRGVQGVPQSVITAFKIGDAQQAVVSMNGAYSVIYGVLNRNKEIDRVDVSLPVYVDVNNVMRSLYSTESRNKASLEQRQSGNKYNLVFILMEGWSADIMSAYGYEKNTTPFFDSLRDKSLSPLGVISGGVRTTEGLYAIFCSQQNPLGETVAQSSLQNNKYECLPEILKDYGWHTAFFQGSHKETSGTGAFAQSLGFTESYAKEDMPSGRYERNIWGAHDPDIYDFLLDKLEKMPQPFLIGVNTNSTHDIHVPSSVKPFFGNENSKQKHDSIIYFSDQALKTFFKKIKKKPYFDDTIFVLVSDHTGHGHTSIAARYFIPGIIYSEKHIPATRLNRYVSHRDFSPTVLDILNLPAAQSFAGKSFLDNNQNEFFADYFHAGTIGWVNKTMLVETSVFNQTDMHCYDIKKGLLYAKSITCDEIYKKESLKSLSFTSYSQHLLFNGRTKSFLTDFK